MKLHEFFSNKDKWCKFFFAKSADDKQGFLEKDIINNNPAIARYDMYGAMIHLQYSSKERNKVINAIQAERGTPVCNFNDSCKSFEEFHAVLKKLDI